MKIAVLESARGIIQVGGKLAIVDSASHVSATLQTSAGWRRLGPMVERLTRHFSRSGFFCHEVGPPLMNETVSNDDRWGKVPVLPKNLLADEKWDDDSRETRS